jgi:hypothetical protein
VKYFTRVSRNTKKLLVTTITNATPTHVAAHRNALPLDAANTDPSKTGVMILAEEFIALSNPMTAPLDVVGTHCINKIGIDGVNRGTPHT